MCIMKILKYLIKALKCIKNSQGDDLYVVLGYLSDSCARSYMSKLKRLGLAYTYVNSGTTEVWIHKKVIEYLRSIESKDSGNSCVKES